MTVVWAFIITLFFQGDEMTFEILVPTKVLCGINGHNADALAALYPEVTVVWDCVRKELKKDLQKEKPNERT